MQIGKLTPQQLANSILCYQGQKRKEVLVSSELGEDSAVVDFGDRLAFFSTDPITGATDRAGWLAVHVSANDVFSNGAEPLGCLMTILAPPTMSLEDIEQVMKDASLAAKEVGIEICGGHTEITEAVNKLVLSATVFGSAPRENIIRTKNARAGDAIVVTKTLGLEGTSILARDCPQQLGAFFSCDDLNTMAAMIDSISVAHESRVAKDSVNAMHDITEGGLLGALYEMAQGANLGFDIDAQFVPLHPLTAQVCARLQVDPLRFLSSGSMLMATADGAGLVQRLSEAGIQASVLGVFTEEPNYLLRRLEHIEHVSPPCGDELWTAFARLTGDS